MHRFTGFGIGASVLLALLPFATSRHLFNGAVNSKFFLTSVVVLALAAFAAALFFRGKHAICTKDRPFLWVVLGALGAYWLSAFLGVYFERSIFSDIQRSTGLFFLTHIAVLAFLLSEFFTARDWSLVRRAVAVSAGIFGFFTLLGAEGFGIDARFLWTNLGVHGYTFGNSTFAGTFLLLALVVALVELVKTSRGTKWFYTLAGSVVFIMLSPILTNAGILFGRTPLGEALGNPLLLLGSARASSAAALGLLVFLAGYWLIKKYAPAHKTYAVGGWAALFVVSILASVVLLFTPGSIVQEKYIEASTAARILVWQGGLEAFKERPLFGWGPENFEQALQGHFNNQLFEKENIGEIWFDRAHNVVVDTLTTAGVVGALAKLALAGGFVWVVYRARRREAIGESEAVILFALPVAHFLQLQTGFDTVGSFVLLGVMGGYALWLERTLLGLKEEEVPRAHALYYKLGAGVLVVGVLASALFLLQEYSRQSALYRLFVEPDVEKKLVLAEAATSRTSSFESLRFSSLSLVKGALGIIAGGKVRKEDINGAVAQLQVFEEQYREYIAAQPNYYRARMTLAYVLSVETILGGENSIEEAKQVIQLGYELSPNHLLTPAMDALLALYSGNLAVAKEKAEEAVALNPDASFSQKVLSHVERQIERFPDVAVYQFDNL